MGKQEPDGFDNAKKSAESYASSQEKTGKLVDRAVAKAQKYQASLAIVWVELKVMLRLLLAWKNGNYKSVPWKTLIYMIAAIIYFVNPFDLIFDMIPFIGFLDDITVIGFVVNSMRGDIDAFVRWEKDAELVGEPVLET